METKETNTPVCYFKMFHLCFNLLLHLNHGASYSPLETSEGVNEDTVVIMFFLNKTVVIMLYNLILD